MNPHDILKYGHLTVLGEVDRFPAEHLSTPGAVGRWSVKDVMAHFLSFELVLVEVCNNILSPCPTPLLCELVADGAAFNDHQVDALRKDMSIEQAMGEYTVAYEKVATLATQLPAGAWRQRGIVPGYGEAYDLEDFIVYTFYGHKREHCGQIELFRDRLQAS